MKCLTPEKTLTGDCEFLAANLYAKSMFGESALANLSIEVGHNGFVQGKVSHRRVGCRNQPIIGELLTRDGQRAGLTRPGIPGSGLGPGLKIGISGFRAGSGIGLRVPGSRENPEFSKHQLNLPFSGLVQGYAHLPLKLK